MLKLARPADGMSACTRAPCPTAAVVAWLMAVLLDAAGRSITPPEPESTLNAAASASEAPIQCLVLLLPASTTMSLADTRPPAPISARTVLSTAFTARAPLAPTTDALTLLTTAL